MQHVWVDGELVGAEQATVSVFDRTLLYGLGAFETFRLWGGVPFLLERHLARLGRSLATLKLPQPEALAGLADGVPALSLACAAPDAVCRITVTAGGAPGASSSDTAAPMRVLAMLRSTPAPSAGQAVEVGVAPASMDASSPVAGVKSTSYLAHYLLRERAEAAGRLDDLLLDAQGRVGEATVSTVFAVLHGQLLTSPLSSGVLEGVTRGEILRLAGELGIETEQRSLTLDELRGADECFLTGAAKGLVCVDRLAGEDLPVARPLSAALASALADRIAAHCGVERTRVGF